MLRRLLPSSTSAQQPQALTQQPQALTQSPQALTQSPQVSAQSPQALTQSPQVSAQSLAQPRASAVWIRALVVYALLLGALVTVTRVVGSTEADSVAESAASPIAVTDAANSAPNSAADPSPNSGAGSAPNSAALAGDLPGEEAPPGEQAGSDGQVQPSDEAGSDGEVQPDGQTQSDGQAQPSDPIQSGDPVSTWPDPINESQLGSEAVYYHYARQDGRSLLRTPTPDNPLRIWVGGDSMAGGPSFGLDTLLGDNPNYEITSEIRKSTGNVANWYFDWPLHMTNEVSEAGYDVIVLSMGGNDKQKFRGFSSAVGEPAWLERYEAAAMSLLNAATRPGRLVVWVGLPHMKPAWLRGFPDIVNPVFEDAVAQLEDAFYVDAAAILTPDGKYVRRLGGEHGNRNVRTADGVHYTFYGGELVSLPIVAEITRRFGAAS